MRGSMGQAASAAVGCLVASLRELGGSATARRLLEALPAEARRAAEAGMGTWGKLDARRLGKLLQRVQDVEVGGWAVRRYPGPENAALWRAEPVAAVREAPRGPASTAVPLAIDGAEYVAVPRAESLRLVALQD